jgi:hypothetical protein
MGRLLAPPTNGAADPYGPTKGARDWVWWLGWEFRVLVPISGTPIGCGIPIPFTIPKILVGFCFEIPISGESENWNSDLRFSEFR